MTKYLLIISSFLLINPCMASADMDKFCTGVFKAVSEVTEDSTTGRPDVVAAMARRSVKLNLKVKDGDPTKLREKGYQEIMDSYKARNLSAYQQNFYKCMNYADGTNIDFYNHLRTWKQY